MEFARATRTGGRPSRRSLAGAAAAALVATTVAATAFTAAPAAAAAGDPFDPSTQRIFTSKSASQADPTGLFELTPNSGGTFTFTQIGPDTNLVHNALTYNPRDNYLYAITGNPLTSDVPRNSLIKIGADGGYSVVGSAQFPDPDDADAQIFLGAIDPTTSTFYVMNGDPATGGNPTSQLIRINLDPSSPGYGTSAGAPVTLSPGWNNINRGSDLTFSNGFLWALGDTALSRVDPSTGVVTTFPVPANADSTENDQAGAAWTFANGDLGFSYNNSGLVIRIRVTNPAAETPTITTILASGGLASGQNDGAAIPGTVDLSIAKSAAKIERGAKARWTLVVRNNGGNPSSGWTVTDNVPAGFTNITAQGGTATSVSGRTVTITGGGLAVGATATITIEATVTDNVAERVTNTAEVVGNEPDAVSSNNEASARLTYVPADDDVTVPGVPATGTAPADGSAVGPALGLLGLLVTLTTGLAFLINRRRAHSA